METVLKKRATPAHVIYRKRGGQMMVSTTRDEIRDQWLASGEYAAVTLPAPGDEEDPLAVSGAKIVDAGAVRLATEPEKLAFLQAEADDAEVRAIADVKDLLSQKNGLGKLTQAILETSVRVTNLAVAERRAVTAAEARAFFLEAVK